MAAGSRRKLWMGCDNSVKLAVEAEAVAPRWLLNNEGRGHVGKVGFAASAVTYCLLISLVLDE